MKNKLLSIGLVAGFSLTTLASCTTKVNYLEKNKNTEVVATLNGEAITISSIYTENEDDADVLNAYYNAISEVLIRQATLAEAEDPACEYYVNNEIDDFVEKAKTTASNNGTSYKEALAEALSGKSVDNLDEYRDKVRYEYLKEKLEEKFYEAQTEQLLDEYIDTVLPYHVSHVLVNVSADSNSFADAKISSSEALKLASVVERLAGVSYKDASAFSIIESFGKVANETSDDNGSRENYGDLGIMSTKTSFVNEFQLGIYAYESLMKYPNGYSDGAFNRGSLFTDDTTLDANGYKSNSYSIPSSEATKWLSRSYQVKNFNNDESPLINIRDTSTTDGVGRIPFSAAGLLRTYNDVTKKDGKEVNDGNENYYPRNIVFNTFFNDHGINVIYNDINANEVGNFKRVYDSEGNPLFGGHPVLCADGNPEKPILVTRAGSSYEGVHFMVVEKSPIGNLKADLKKYWNDKTKSELENGSDEEKGFIGQTYVTLINSSNPKDYTERSNTVSEAVKGFDEMLDAKIYEYYLSKTELKFKDETKKAALETYISNQREANKVKATNAFEQRWFDYLNLLTEEDIEAADRIPLVCATKFEFGGSYYEKGGLCYEEK